MSRHGFLVSGAVLFLALIGCGGTGGSGGPKDFDLESDEGKVQALVDKFADYTSSLELFRSLYSKEAQPSKADMAKFKDAFFYVSKSNPPKISGDSATIPLTSEDTEGNETHVSWTAVKEDGEWKLKETPLP